MQSGWYMASTSNIDTKYRSTIGHIEGLANIRPVALRESKVWCLDNSVFTGKFSEKAWLQRLESVQSYKSTCLFATVPDVVGDFHATLKRFKRYRKMLNLPAAFVSQDGIQANAGQVPWDDFDCIFVGGSDQHKLGTEGRWVIEEAKKRNKWVHVGRVNSIERVRKFWMADSWDGTNLSFAPSNVAKFHAAVLQARAMKQSKGLFDEIYSPVFGSNSVSKSV